MMMMIVRLPSSVSRGPAQRKYSQARLTTFPPSDEQREARERVGSGGSTKNGKSRWRFPFFSKSKRDSGVSTSSSEPTPEQEVLHFNS